MKEYLVVGCGLTGATIARQLAEAGNAVTVWDRRGHIAGNMYDYVDGYGVLVHAYGPHTFHTDDDRAWGFVSRFEEWRPFKLVCGAAWDGKYTPTAFNFKTIDVFYSRHDAERLKGKLVALFPGRESAPVTELLAHEDADVRGFAKLLFENDYAPYTAKQWGLDPSEIDPSVLARVPIRFSYEEAYFADRYQFMPAHSYTRMFENILDHSNITVELGIEALGRVEVLEGRVAVDGVFGREVVWTGAMDELFGCCFGELPYRSLRFDWVHDEIDSFQDAPVVAYPKAEGYTRITEYKKLPEQDVAGTTYALEYPLPYTAGQKGEPYYPVLTGESQNLFDRYRTLAAGVEGLECCGRLADFRYYNMDQALVRALDVSARLLSGGPSVAKRLVAKSNYSKSR